LTGRPFLRFLKVASQKVVHRNAIFVQGTFKMAKWKWPVPEEK